jgi:hypothetical protein
MIAIIIPVPKRIPICQNPYNLCTEDCPFRPTCTISRVPMLIHSVVIHYRLGRIYGDDYINELMIMRCDSIDSVCHPEGIDLKEKLRPMIRMEAL